MFDMKTFSVLFREVYRYMYIRKNGYNYVMDIK